MTELTKLKIAEIFEILPEVQLSKLPELITEIVEHIDEFDYDTECGRLSQWNLILRLLYSGVNYPRISNETLEKMYLIFNAYQKFAVSKLYE